MRDHIWDKVSNLDRRWIYLVIGLATFCSPWRRRSSGIVFQED